MEEVFRGAYLSNAWGDPESASGHGSSLQRTAAFRDQIPALLHALGAHSLLDAGCGDFNWMKALALPVSSYVGVDIVPELIAHDRRWYHGEERVFLHLDITEDDLPPADVVLCRDCLVHFSLTDALAALNNFKRSGSRYLLATTFIQVEINEDISTGGWRPLNLERPPFCFPSPRHMIDEKCLHTGGIYADKRLALWRLADLLC
jgi:SAM-dependent methyltransferase